MLAEGGRVVAADISEKGLADTRKSAEHASTKVGLDTVVVDIGDESSVITVVGQAISALGGLDVLVNAAGILRGGHTHETSLDLWNQVISVNLTGTFLVTRQALPALLSTGNAVVMNFSSSLRSLCAPVHGRICGE